MIIKQRGLMVVIFRALAILFLLASMYGLLAAFVNLILLLINIVEAEVAVASIVLSLLTSVVFAIPAWFVLWIFPNIRVSEIGLEFRSLMLHNFVPWHEVTGITDFKRNGFQAILLKRSNPTMFWNRLYGNFIGRLNQPVVILAIDDASLGTIRSEVKKWVAKQ
jgi:hypothetical protein